MPIPSTLLIFPAGIDGTQAYAQTARQLGAAVIGATSVPLDHAPAHCDALITLPFITDTAFAAAFQDAIARHGITHVLAPHHGVWWHLRQLLDQGAGAAFELCGQHPFQAHWDTFQPHLAWADQACEDALAQAVAGARAAAPMSRLQYASLHRGFLRTPGETDEEKLLALTAIARLLPQGDVVEIGSLYGRSAYALSRLAQHYGIGSTLCVDPWRMEQIEDQGPAAQNLYDGRKLINLDHVFAQFCATACEAGAMGYIRAPSVDAIHAYRTAAQHGQLHNPELPPIAIQGRIALLHIDGNHRLDHVVQDIATWAPSLIPGGWLLLDDYVWTYGDGPQRAGDALLQGNEYDCAFTASDTLFLRRRLP